MLKARSDGRLVIALNARDIETLMDGDAFHVDVHEASTDLTAVVLIYGDEAELGEALDFPDRPS